MSQIDALLESQAALEQERKPWEKLWRDCATYIDPASDDFGSTNEYQQAQKKGEKVFDTTALTARDRLAAAHESTLTPQNAKWAGLKATVEAVNEDEETKEYFEEINTRLFAARARPEANFVGQNGQYFQQLDTFGTSAMFIDERMGRSLRYKCPHLNEIYIALDFQGRPNRVHRKFQLTAGAAMSALKAGKFERLPAAVMRAAQSPGNRHDKFWFVHCVYENEAHGAGYGFNAVRNSWAFESVYYCVEHNEIVAESGYRAMPYAVGRYSVGPRETYGRAPGMKALRAIQMLQELGKTLVRQVQRAADPPMFMQASAPGAMPFSLQSGKFNYGMLDADGRPKAAAFNVEADLSALLELIKEQRIVVNDAFMVTLFQIMVENPNQTATEALLRAQEKGQLLGPTLGRQQSDYLGPLILRELDILTEAGEFDDLPMPRALLEAGGGVEIVYDAPINRLMRAEEAIGLIRTAEALMPFAEAFPEMLDVFEPTVFARTVAEANGAPAKGLRSVEEMALIAEQRQREKQLQQGVAAAKPLADAARALAQAQAVAQNSPPAIPLVNPANG